MNTCGFDAALLDLFLDGALSPEEMERVQAHLDICPECQSYIDDVLTMRDFFPDAEDVELPENFAAHVMAEVAKAPQSRPRKQPWGKLAAAAACLALIVAFQQFGLPFGSGGSKNAASIVPAALCEAAPADCAEETPAEAAEPNPGLVANGAFSEAAKDQPLEDTTSAERERDSEILVTAVKEDLADLLEGRTPDETTSAFTCYLLATDDPLVAELVNRGFLQELPGNDCTVRLEICSK